MAIRIYRYRKPELTINLTAGGSLVEDTLYYITGFFKKNTGITYNSSHGPFADVDNFTTDSVNKSITVGWKVTVPIQGFVDAGGGQIRVTAANHCTNNESITIESGVYAGVYSTTREDYNTFLITETYSSTYETTFRVEVIHNASNGLVLYISTVEPFSGLPENGTWTGYESGFSHRSWITGYTTNDFLVDDITSYYRTYSVIPQVWYTDQRLAPWCKVMEKGNPYIHIESDSTVDELRQACIDADIEDVAYVDDNSFVAYAIIYSPGVIDFTDMNITVYIGVMTGPNINFLRCNCQFLEYGYGSYWRTTANYSNFLFIGGHLNSGPYSYATGIGNAMNSDRGLRAEGMGNNFTVDGLTFNSENGSWNLDMSNDTRNYLNCTMNTGGYLYLYYNNNDPGAYLNGFTINTTKEWDIGNNYQNTYDMILYNFDTLRTNNEKIVYNTSNAVHSHYYHRSGTINIKDSSGVVVVGADVNLTDDAQNSYDYTTDEFGNVDFDILEQVSVSNMLPSGYYISTLYLNWITTVSKNGFPVYIGIDNIPKNIDKFITLIQPPPVYVSTNITATIEEQVITAKF